jgi:adenylosuccinate lyase
MEPNGIYRNLSPLDHRYYLANEELFEALRDRLSEEASLRYRVKAEVALIEALLTHLGTDSAGAEETLARIGREGVPAEEVAQEERKTRHDVRALVNVLKRYLPESIRPLVHLGATSYDIRDTATAMQLRDAVREVVLPLCLELEARLIRLAREEAATAQVGRTHGQFAVPLTFGFAVAEYVSRAGKCIENLTRISGDLRGKLSGAVGAYNATSLILEDPLALERTFLERLGLRASDHSTQIVEPEHELRLLTEMNVLFGVVANLADDLRNLQRSEIDEVREGFAAGQVGSSTMPQKRNPWNSEHVKSLWKTFAPRSLTWMMDQISEHQRDLTNSASSRFVAEYVAGFCAAVARMVSILEKLAVNRQGMEKNLERAGDMVLAEAAYILLALEGHDEAHELIREATLEAERGSSALVDVLENRGLSGQAGQRLRRLLEHPSSYRGRSAEVARKVADDFERRMSSVGEELGL